MTDNIWLQTATRNLLALSINKSNFQKARNEWIYAGLEDNEYSNYTCKLCEHPDIRYEYTIRNINNENKMIVGSSCINKFVDTFEDNNETFYDEDNNIVTKNRIKTDKKNYWKKILSSALKDKFYDGEFQQSISDIIIEEEKLTINQAKYLINFYDSLSQNEQSAFRHIVKIKLRRDKHKGQYTDLNSNQKNLLI
ncbi:hypothetical protein JCM15457_920 [Liquorilactobacillus sucicola DSM 21376 = JCM 15457]|uniref:Uncharacterized protein n=1 Tax=Liquorilactobacillus sucicola DSM 21376 = JCM 15457 TaxID=1423806 RepID=A0A023CVT2_9LACO|nr:hypothetical protein [Liquorilactobacillus sucicola]KRN06086.1 hypothetical protein FD15_GL001276 [Liquorilactobacillus sucicola DSM 21376 = JCM 15457]GAJ26013.1 hypothetical protein JCM15457_920 [Liquorilactobacillus sucicola DSM 21376 = JCM 15457]